MSPRTRARDQALAAEFGRRVREARLAAGMTQEGLAEAAGLHPTYISNVERAYSGPNLYAIVRLAEGLRIDTGELMQGLHTQQ